MLQIRASKSILISQSGDIETEISSDYSEPGFISMSPLEIEIQKCDKFVLRVRKRADGSGTSFTALPANNITATVVDSTNGKAIPFQIDRYDANRVEITIANSLSMTESIFRVKTLDICVVDTTDNDSVTLRVVVDSDMTFDYLYVPLVDMKSRGRFSNRGNDIYVAVKRYSESYLLFCPNFSFREVLESDDYSFSYPINSVFYKKQESYNDEEFTYEITKYSHDFVEKDISLLNVPSYGKAGILLIDRKLYRDINENGINPYIEISVTGKLSETVGIFKVNFRL